MKKIIALLPTVSFLFISEIMVAQKNEVDFSGTKPFVLGLDLSQKRILNITVPE